MGENITIKKIIVHTTNNKTVTLKDTEPTSIMNLHSCKCNDSFHETAAI